MTGIPYPITSYPIPPAAPQAVEDAWHKFTRLGALVEDTKSDLADAKQAVIAAQAADVRAVVAAAGEGVEPNDPETNERKALAEVSRIETLLKGYRVAVDEAGNTLADVIEEHQAEWERSLVDAQTAASERYDRAIVEARAALTALVPAQAGTTWLRGFDAGEAKQRRHTGFAGGRLKVSGHGRGIAELRRDYNPADLLAVAALATAAPKSKEIARAA